MDTSELKDTNPKDAIGSTKLPFHLVPDTLKAYAALAFCEGATKYGAYNWRIAGVRASIYKSALERHLAKWWNGEDCDPDTGVPHLASVIACAGILLDAKLVGKLTDDRPPVAPMADLIDNFEGIVRHLQNLHKDKNPRHWTIEDSDPLLGVLSVPEVIPNGDVWVNHTTGLPMPECLRGKRVYIRCAGLEESSTAFNAESLTWGFIPRDPAAEIIAWKLAE